MPIISFPVSLHLPYWIYSPLKSLKLFFWGHKKQCNLWGDREVEYSFIFAHMPRQGGMALDFGTGRSYISLGAAFYGFQVIALDQQPQIFAWRHPSIKFLKADLFNAGLNQNYFDLIINCSAIEHVGLAGRYGIKDNLTDGDFEAMLYLKELMKSQGTMLLTVPVGQDAIFPPFCRIYGNQRLPRLLQGYIVEREEYWIKALNNQWVLSDKGKALDFRARVYSSDPQKCIYALGCFVLKCP